MNNPVEELKEALQNSRNAVCIALPSPDVIGAVKDYEKGLEAQYNEEYNSRHLDDGEFEIEERVRRLRYITAKQSAALEIIELLKKELSK